MTTENGGSGTLGEMLRRRLDEVDKTAEQLAASVDLPVEYINGLIDRTMRPPKPSRSDIYDKMTRCLRLGRKELANAADAERAGEVTKAPTPAVARALLEYCEPETAANLGARGNRAQLTDAVQRLLDLIQASVCRLLSDPVTMRVSAGQRGISYQEQRVRILKFLDTSADSLSVSDVAEFVQPRLEQWNVDPATSVLTIVMRSHEPRHRHRRQPSVRRTV